MAKRNKQQQFMYHLKMANKYMNEIKKCGPNDWDTMQRLKKKMAKHVERAKALQVEST